MSDSTSGGSGGGGSSDDDEKCPLCGKKKHDKKFRRSKSERKKALLRDAKDPNSGLSDRARKKILATNGNNVPTGHQVSHEEPLYTLDKSERCTLDNADNMKTQHKSVHKKRHQKCGDQYHAFPA
jgi:hypothetical protein